MNAIHNVHNAVHNTAGGHGARRDVRNRQHGERALSLLQLVFLAGMTAGPLSCRSTAPPEPNGGLTVSLDAVPLLLKADSVAASTIWATVLEKGHPVSDSTMVNFVTTIGTITAEAFTRDGLAKATFEPDGQAGLAAVVAQVRAVRDTVLVTVY